MQELKLLKNHIEDIAQEIIAKFVAVTGLPIPKHYKFPPVKFVQDKVIQKVGKKPLYLFIHMNLINLQKKLGKSTEPDFKELREYCERLNKFVEAAKKEFDETSFESLDEEWLSLSYRLRQIPELAKCIASLQTNMDMLYEREYAFAVCGDYSYNQQMIYFYETNIINRLTQDSNYALIPPQQALECILAHEIFHSLHFMCMHDACLANNMTVLKLFNPPNISSSVRKTIIKKRKTVIESLAKYFEYCYARDKGYIAYAINEKHNFVGKRKHFPAWPYAGARGLIATNNDEAFREALRASIDIAKGRGFSDAYAIIARANSER